MYRSPGRLNFVRWRLIFVGLQLHVTLLVFRILRWLLDFCVTLFHTPYVIRCAFMIRRTEVSKGVCLAVSDVKRVRAVERSDVVSELRTATLNASPSCLLTSVSALEDINCTNWAL